MLLQLTDGTTTLTLSGDGSYYGVTYFPRAGDGATATDEVELILSGSAAEKISALRAVQQLLAAAMRWERTRSGNRIYLIYQADGASVSYRSPVRGGRAELDQMPGARQLGWAKVKALVDVVREPWWEESMESTAVSNAAMTNGGTGVSLPAGAVTGVLETPARLEIKTNQAVNWDRFWIWNNAFNGPSQIAPLGAKSISWSSEPQRAEVASWTLAGSVLDQMRGDSFRLVALFDRGGHPMPTNCLWSAGLYYSVTETAFTGEQWTGDGLTKDVFDLGALPIPAGAYYESNADLTLKLLLTHDGAGQVNLNRLALVGAEPGGFRHLEQNGYTALANDVLLDDPEAGTHLLRAGKSHRLFSGGGEPLMLQPGRQQYIHVIFDEVSQPGYVATRSMSLTVKYRARIPLV